VKPIEVGAALSLGAFVALAGCAVRRPVLADVRCPQGTTMVLAGNDGRCILPDGKQHGPSWTASASGVSVEGYDHGVPAGPYAKWDARGELVAQGYRPGVTDSTEGSPEIGRARWDSPKTDGVLVWPERVRVFPVQVDAAFSAGTIVAAQGGRQTSSFVGATLAVGLTPPENVRYRSDAYKAWFIAYGAQGLAGTVARAECDDPAIAGSGGFCGSRWMAGPYVRIGYFTSNDARASGALPTLLGYGRIGLLIGQDRWSSTYSTGSSLVWRARAGAGYSAFGAVEDLVRRAQASPTEGWRWLLVPLAVLLEHAEGYVELGGDGGASAGSLGVGAGVDVGFGL